MINEHFKIIANIMGETEATEEDDDFDSDFEFNFKKAYYEVCEVMGRLTQAIIISENIYEEFFRCDK